MTYTCNDMIFLHYNCSTKGATSCLNRRTDLNDFIDLYHDEDLSINEEAYTFFICSV